jgi:Protein of unknown function (DUF2891)
MADDPGKALTLERCAALALACVRREFPYQPAHVVRDASDLRRPREMHPAFFGCFDWHSAVHAHWTLAHMLRSGAAQTQAPAIRAVLNAHLTAANLEVEARYLAEHPWFERPYGWAWLLELAHELRGWQDVDARRWLEALAPLTAAVERLFIAWLPKQAYAIRSGVHTNTAFALALALDYAEAAGRDALREAVLAKSIQYYLPDRDYPAAWEPGGNDFLSPCLVEADLMRRVLQDFARWFDSFVPAMPASLLTPAAISDREDGQLVHLDGLNLSRAWCFCELGKALERDELLQAAERHLRSGLSHFASGSYEGEHWLASFAVRALAAAP